MRTVIAIAALVLVVASVVGCAQAKGLASAAGVNDKTMKSAEKEAGGEAKKAADEAPKDIVQLAGYKGLTQLTAALAQTGLDKTLQGPGPFTVFAPSDEAFNKIPADKRAVLMSDKGKDQLTKILSYHVVNGKLSAADLAKAPTQKTANGADVAIVAKDGKVKVGNATVTVADLQASNGVVHVIDTVLMPPGM